MSPGHDDHNQPAPPGALGGAPGVRWLAGDHHVHTQYSAGAMYRVIDQARHARAYGLDWLVITNHGGPEHSRIGVDKVHPKIVAARAELPDLLVFQGLEWNTPNADHGSVFVSPGPNEVAVLKDFEKMFDGSLMPPLKTAAQNAAAVAGITFLGERVRDGRSKRRSCWPIIPRTKGSTPPTSCAQLAGRRPERPRDLSTYSNRSSVETGPRPGRAASPVLSPLTIAPVNRPAVNRPARDSWAFSVARATPITTVPVAGTSTEVAGSCDTMLPTP